MNIFATAQSPTLCAMWLDDLRLAKMALETAQLLCTAHHVLGTPMQGMYKPTHENHPCAIWARETLGNYQWLFDHFQALCEEFRLRSGKEHASADLALLLVGPPAPLLNKLNKARTKFANVTPHAHLESPEAYRRYMREKWLADKRPPKFRLRGWPLWAAEVPVMRERAKVPA